jgi:HD-GYP domain-containing protein (c-di-GMP phosphodiesterase class II)
MTTIISEFPVKTLDGSELIAAGTEVNEEILEELARVNTSTSYDFLPFMDYGRIRQDLLSFIKYPPYDVVFSEQEENEEIFKILGSVKLPLPVLESMDYFKKNDFQTYRHTLMVFIISVLLADILMPDSKEPFSCAFIGSSHDIGKTCIPLEILKKPTPLTKSEHKYLKHHTIAGHVLLSYYLKNHKSFIARLARDHHERRDRSCYPRGIEQTDAMIEIVAVADVYDALLMPRAYRPISYDNRTALEEMTIMAERGAIGWEVVKALIARNRLEKPIYHEIALPVEKRGKAPMGNIYGEVEED